MEVSEQRVRFCINHTTMYELPTKMGIWIMYLTFKKWTDSKHLHQRFH